MVKTAEKKEAKGAKGKDNSGELKELLKKARKRDLPFAFGKAKKAEDHQFVMDLKRNGKVLAKQMEDVGAVTWGRAKVDGKEEITLLCEKRLAGVDKEAKKMFKAKKIPITKVHVQLGDGAGTEVDSKPYLDYAKEWDKVLKTAGKQIDNLKKTLVKEVGDAAKDIIKGVDDILKKIPSLGDVLGKCAQAAKKGDEAAIQKQQTDARKILTDSKSYINNNSAIDNIEDNPFVKVDLKKTFNDVFAKIQKNCPGLK